MNILRLVIIFAIGCTTGPSRLDLPAQPPAQPVSTVPADPLAVRTPIKASITGGQTRRYRVQLAEHQVARGVVMQEGLDLALVTFDPSGKQLGSFDSPNGNMGPEPFSIVAGIAGGYDVEIRPFVEPGAAGPKAPEATGTYTVVVDELIDGETYAEIQAKERIDSPAILAAWKTTRAKQPLDKFWADLKGHAPIVEDYPGDARSSLVTFVFRSTATYVGLFGGPSFVEKPMVRLAGTDLWYLSARMPIETSVDYAFIAADGAADFHTPFKKGGGFERFGMKVQDPNNAKTHFDMSRVELRDARPMPYIDERPTVARGKVDKLEIESKALKEKRKLGVYTPTGYDPKKTYPLVVVFDGEVYGLDPQPLIPLPTILDNMIADGKLPPVVAVLVANQGTRDKDLPGSAPFASFVATELVPLMRAQFHAGLTPAATLVTGSSFGGLASAYIGFLYSDVVGLVLSNSGSFQYVLDSIGKDISPFQMGSWLTRLFAGSPKLPLTFYLDAGLFEMGLLDSNRQMDSVLRAKGYLVAYREFAGAHDYAMWRGTISDGLEALLGPM